MENQMKATITVFLAAIALAISAEILYSDDPEPGKQVAQTIEIPKQATSAPRPRLTDEEQNAERIRRDALTQEQRDAENRDRRMRSVDDTKAASPLSDAETQTFSYLLFLPNDYDAKSDKKWPLLLFLHGAGERGSNIEKVKVHGPPKLVSNADKAKDWPFITVSPQTPDNGSWSPQQLGKLLDEIEAKYAVDKSRVYVTGLSMGGFGTWSLLNQFPDRFAAGVPICGGFTPAAAENLINTPIWVFHGAKDSTVRVNLSTEMVDAIKEKGGKKVKITIYPDLGHDSWTVTYDNQDLYKWLLEQKLDR